MRRNRLILLILFGIPLTQCSHKTQQPSHSDTEPKTSGETDSETISDIDTGSEYESSPDTLTDPTADSETSTQAPVDGGDTADIPTTDDSEIPDTASNTIDTDTDSKPYENTGVCGVGGEATVTADTYEGFEDHYLVGNEGDGPDICRVRFTVTRVGPPAVPCELCEWAFVLKRSQPEVVTELDNGCAMSALGLNAAAIAALDDEEMTIGFVSEYVGHSSVLMMFNEETGAYTAVGNASFNPETGAFYYDRRDGFCGY